ncbi:MAG: hypothetical protein MUF15_06785 [Acidobacteria bacterium]|jgi:hypothetical protein|nr:hypothetical protein [Acidobacteriota bacterium]
MKSAINIYLSLHTQISRAEKQTRKSETAKSEGYLTCFGNHLLDHDLIGGEEYLPGDAAILLKGERGTHKFALALNYLFQGLRNGENVVLFNMGSAVDIKLIPQCSSEKQNDRIFFNDETNNDHKPGFSLVNISSNIDKPPEGKYKIHWWRSGQNEHSNWQNQANLFILDFDAGFLLPEEFIATFVNLVEWIKSKGTEDQPTSIQRILINSTTLIKTRFPVLEEESFLIPAFIRLTKCYGISSMIIDVPQQAAADAKKIVQLDALSDLIITLEHNWQENYKIDKGTADDNKKLKIVTADNITGKVYEKKWLGLWIDEPNKNERNLMVKEIIKIIKDSK